MADGPAGYWRLGETSGFSAADATKTSNGTYSGGVMLGRVGALTADPDTAVLLDGINDTVSVPNTSTQSSGAALSLESWIHPTALPSGTASIIRKDFQYLVRLTSTGSIIFRLWKAGAEREFSTPAGAISADRWHHVVTTYDGATLTIYVNGRARASLALTGPVDVSQKPLYFGSAYNAYDWFGGKLDELAVYTKALTAARVQEHYQRAGVIDTTPSTVRLDAPTAGSTMDATPIYGGSAGTDAADANVVSINVYQGTTVSGTPVQSLTTSVRSAGTFSVEGTPALPSGTYTAQAVQSDAAGNIGRSVAKTFTVDASADPVLLAAGDIAACDTYGDEVTAALLDGLPGSVALLGDLAYEYATASDFANCYDPTWGRHKARSRPSPGSHDYGEYQTNGEAYYGYFGAVAGDPAKGYYSYDIGDWHVIALNSVCSKVGGCGAGSPQERWLRADLAANASRCTLAFWHDPRFSSGSIHGSNAAFQPFWQALYDHNADVVLNGHEHSYERFAPQTPAGAADATRGIREFVVGSGGRSHYGFGTIRANSQARNSDAFGVLRLTLRPAGYDWQFVPEPGKTFADSGSGACH